MALRMKTSGKFLIGFLLFLALFVGLRTTGLWDKIFPRRSSTSSSVPQIDGITSKPGIPGTKVVRLAHWTWNAHQSWALANKGKNGSADSILAKHGVTAQFHRIEEIPNQIAAFKAFAAAYDRGEQDPSEGVHFFTIMGDAAGWVMNDTNKALKDVDSSLRAEIIGFSGFSAGEDKFMGPPEWKRNPKAALGGVVAGVAADGDWNIMIFWCAQNQIPFNADKKTYDPNALNFVATDSYIQAGEVYIANKPVERTFKADGKDVNGKAIKAGETGSVAINGVVTWTPVDKNVADARGGLVSIVSTKEYSNQMPMYIIGLKQWNEKNKDTVVNLLSGLFEASDLINESEKQLRAGVLAPRSDADYRWQAARYAQEIFESENPEYWYKYFVSVPVRDKQGLTVDIGGSAVSNLQRNLKFFGLDGGTNIGEVVYHRFAKLAKFYYPDFIEGYPDWNIAFNPAYLKGVEEKSPALARTDPNLPVFSASTGGEQMGELTYRIAFESGRASFTEGAESTLKEALEQLVIAANSRIEIHGHTDSEGDPAQNMDLSKRRGEAVYAWLRAKSGASFPANRVVVIPHGQTELLVQDTRDGHSLPDKMAQNRRVVIKIFKRQS